MAVDPYLDSGQIFTGYVFVGSISPMLSGRQYCGVVAKGGEICHCYLLSLQVSIDDFSTPISLRPPMIMLTVNLGGAHILRQGTK